MLVYIFVMQHIILSIFDTIYFSVIFGESLCVEELVFEKCKKNSNVI